MNNFASMLKYLRERENLTQRELAKKLGISASAICMYENGNRHPKPEDEEAIADFFNVDLNTLRGKYIDENVPEMDARTKRFVNLFQSVSPDVQRAVEILLKSAQQDP